MRRRSAWLAAGILTTAALAPVIPSAQAATGCKVDYTVQSAWAGGFQGAISVTNLGDTLSGWTLTFTFPDSGQKVTQGWNGVWTQTGAAVKVVNPSWNATLPASQPVALGFLAETGGVNPVPTSFQLNG